MTVDGFKADNIVDGSDPDDNDSMDCEDEDGMISRSENEDDDMDNDDGDEDKNDGSLLEQDDNINCGGARTFGVPHSNIGVRMFSPRPTSRREKKK